MIQAAIDDLFGLPVRWVKTDAMHLTLQFLGNIPVEQVGSITQAIQQVTCEMPACTVNVRSLGCFPTGQRPRILWMGCDDAEQKLASLQRHRAKALLPVHVTAEQHLLRPHSTLERFRVGQKRSALSPVKYQDYSFGNFLVEEVHLFQSELHPQGASYVSLFVSSLEKSFCQSYNSSGSELSNFFEKKVSECDLNHIAN